MYEKSVRYALLSVLVVTTAAGCSDFVKKTDYDAAISELRNNDQKQQQQLDALAQEMHSKFATYDTQIAQMQGRVRVDGIAHFDFGQDALRDQDKPLLDDFAKSISSHYPGALVTVEGFADPAGGPSFNKRLGMKRADAVRDYLVSQGLSADRVRAVSYGEAADRQVDKGATADKGESNRRATLVVDFAGSVASAAPASSPPPVDSTTQ